MTTLPAVLASRSIMTLIPLLVFLSGCAGVPLKQGSASRARPGEEPTFCLTGAAQGTYLYAVSYLGFRSMFSNNPAPEPAENCDVMLNISATGASIFATGTIEAYSAYTGEQIWKGSSSGELGTHGVSIVGQNLKRDFQPGYPGYLKLAATKPGGAEPASAAPVAAAPPAPARPRSDIDDLPPAGALRKAHAVVIGVENYREALPKADFAASDAKLAAEYFKRVLGVPEENVAVLADQRAAKGDFEKYFERWLPNRVEKDDEVYVYFSGHGAPNPKSGEAYLVPWDADPTYIEQTGYSIKRLYTELAKLPAKRVLVAMDSCFSGAGGRSVIAKGARPLVSVQSADVPEKITVISASAGDQISNSYQAQGHGLFTYFLLKGLKQKGGDLRAVFDYLKPEVARVARREYNADQEPQWREAGR